MASFSTVWIPGAPTTTTTRNTRITTPKSGLDAIYLPWLLVLPVLLTGGGYHVWSQAAILLIVGVWTLCRPPLHALPAPLSAVALACMLLAVAQLLPGLGFIQAPHWRASASALGIDTGTAVSAQPRVGAEALLLLLAGWLWLLMICQRSYTYGQRKRLLVAVATAGAVMGLLVFTFTVKGFKNPLAAEVHCFSFLPNRNQMSLVFASTAVIAFGLAWQALRKKGTLAWGYLALCLGSGLGLSGSLSRAGVILFFVGIVVWLVARPRLRMPTSRWKALPPFLVIIALGFLLAGPKTALRVANLANASSGGGVGFRGLVYQDTLRMIADQPWAGVGLGNFAYVFPQYREASASPSWALHPESDWFWLTAELGLPALLLLLVATVWVLRMLWRRIRRGDTCEGLAAVALLLFVLHSFFDVAGHRLGTWMWFSGLFALAWNRGAAEHSGDAPPPILFQVLLATGARMCGLLLAGAGLLGCIAWAGGLPWHSQLAMASAREALRQAVAAPDTVADDALGSVSQAVDRVPLAWSPRFDMAQILFHQGHYTAAGTKFRQARFLNPLSADIALAEGRMWQPLSTGNALNAYREAVGRYMSTGEQPFARVLQALARDPRYQPGLEQLSRLNPRARFRYLMSRRSEDYLHPFMADFARDPLFAGTDPDAAGQLLLRALRVGGAPLMAPIFRAQPAVEQRFPLPAALAYGLTGDHQSARALLAEHLVPPEPSAYGSDFTLDYLWASHKRHPEDHALTLALVQRLVADGRYSEALEAIGRVRNLGDAPAPLRYWNARLHMESGDMDKAWMAWIDYLM